MGGEESEFLPELRETLRGWGRQGDGPVRAWEPLPVDQMSDEELIAVAKEIGEQGQPYEGTLDDGRELQAAIEGLVLEGRVPMGWVDWTHPRTETLAQWKRRVGRHKPDGGKVLRDEVCSECGKTIPLFVAAVKDDVIIESWGGVLFADGLVCDDCSPI